MANSTIGDGLERQYGIKSWMVVAGVALFIAYMVWARR